MSSGKRPYSWITNFVPDRSPCPDCSGVFRSGEMHHDDSCPAARGLDAVTDADRQWFEEHPQATEYWRPMTQAEALYDAPYRFLAEYGYLPTGTCLFEQARVQVVSIAPGVRGRRFHNYFWLLIDPEDE